MIYYILLAYTMYFAIYSVLLSKLMKFYKGLNKTNIEPPSKIDYNVFIQSADNFMKEINDYPKRQ